MLDNYTYFARRVRQEDQAALNAACEAARERHEQLGDAYRDRCARIIDRMVRLDQRPTHCVATATVVTIATDANASRSSIGLPVTSALAPSAARARIQATRATPTPVS